MKEKRRTQGPKRFVAYPTNFENKVGFDKVRNLIGAFAESPMGKVNLEKLAPTASVKLISKRLEAVKEMMELLQSREEFPSLRFDDLSRDIQAIAAEGSYIASERLPQLRLFLRASEALRLFFSRRQEEQNGEKRVKFPTLSTFLVEGIEGLLPLLRSLEKILDPYGHIADKASPQLYELRREIEALERQNSKIARQVLAGAIAKGWAEEGSLPTLREGHTVIPIIPANKRQVQGVVFDESATGKTLFVEPLEVIENSNRVRELHHEEKREIIRLLIAFTEELRPHARLLLSLHLMIGVLDGIRAIALFALEEHGVVPRLRTYPYLHWIEARHPILRRSLEEQGRKIVPLDLFLNCSEERVLVISGPNAGGKSVCLKTVALLQYMLQCGIPIPVHPDSEAGVFDVLAINIGDDQSLEDDLSTYSSHLRAMAAFCKLAGPRTLLMVDEFGSGTEPELGGAIAEALLAQFNASKSLALVTTHYRNLKQFASQTEGFVNGAMLYDRGAMRPLFRLSIGQPGSSFALEIAHRSGIPQGVLEKAKNLVGEKVVNSDSYVQDIARDKSYWQRKREEIRRQSNQLTRQIEEYKSRLEKLQKEEKKILSQAKEEASTIIKDSNALVERTVREIKESQARRTETLQARQRLSAHLQQLQQDDSQPHEREEEDASANKSHKKQRKEKWQNSNSHAESQKKVKLLSLAPGDTVRIEPEGIEATVVERREGEVLLALGNSLSIIKPLSALVPLSRKQGTNAMLDKKSSNITEHIHEKKIHFQEELDVRGMRAVDALQQVDYFVDEALQVGSSKIKILHGTGTGALRQSIREHLATSPLVRHFEDEDVRFGGAGITVVYF